MVPGQEGIARERADSGCGARESSRATARERDVFLPDFCAIPVVFSVVIIGELLAFVLVLAGAGAGPLEPAIGGGWANLAMVSLFIQWVGLSSAGVLCALRSRLVRLGDGGAGVASLLVVLVVTAIATEIAYWTLEARWSSLALGAAGASAAGLGDLGHGSHVRLVLANLGVALIVSALALRYFYIQHHWRRQIERESSARVQALQARIRPHFLFNSMNTIAAFTRTQPEVAEQVVEDLADLFRVTLRDAEHPSTLGEELEVCRQYARIEQRRLGERLQVHWPDDDLPENTPLPTLTLQPLLENAVYHGVEPRREGGVIRVSGHLEGASPAQWVVLTIDNPHPEGDGVPGSDAGGSQRGRALPQRPASRPQGHQMAMANVRERLLAFFGDRAEFSARRERGRFRVRLRFPVLGSDDPRDVGG